MPPRRGSENRTEIPESLQDCTSVPALGLVEAGVAVVWYLHVGQYLKFPLHDNRMRFGSANASCDNEQALAHQHHIARITVDQISFFADEAGKYRAAENMNIHSIQYGDCTEGTG